MFDKLKIHCKTIVPLTDKELNLIDTYFEVKKLKKKDLQSIIDKQNKNSEYANWKVMSFTYLAWAKQRQRGKYRNQSLIYTDKAIALDPNYKEGRQKTEDLKAKMMK